VQAQANGAVRELKTTALSEIAREDPRLRELARSVADAEPVDEGGPISAERIMERYNGHPGGLVAGPEAMGRVYEGLNDDQRTILRAAKVLKWLGVRELNSERLAEAAKLIARKRRRLEPVLDELRKIGFVARHAAAGGNDKSSASLHAMPTEEERPAGELEQHSAEVRPFDYATLKGTLRQRLEAVQLGAQEDESPSSGNGAAAHQDRLDTALLGGATVEEDASPTEGDAALSPGEEAEAIRPAQADAALPQDRPAEVKLEFYQVYLDQVVDLPEEASALEPQLLEAWRKRGDAEAFVDRGDRATDPDSGTFKADPKTSLEKGIGCYMEALGFYRPETEPPDAADGVEYVDTLTKLGSAYASLARHQEPVENLQKSIQAFQLALSFPTAGATADQFAATHKRLGDAYASMARQQEPVENLGQAIQAFHEAIEYQKLEEGPLRMPVRLEHAATHNNLGSAHASLARHQEPVANLGLAIRAFQEAVKLHAQERAPKMSAGEFPPESAAGLQYGATQNNLGNAYASLAHYQAPVENLRNATHAYFEALRFLTPATAPGQHAAIQKKLAVVFAELIEGPGPMQLTPTIPTNPPGHTPRP
jgi:tetratricopeptide (TPR) repeat protein